MKRPDPMTLAIYASAFSVGPAILVVAPALIGTSEPQAATASTVSPEKDDKAAAVDLPEIETDGHALSVYQASERLSGLPIDVNPYIEAERIVEIDEIDEPNDSMIARPDIRLGTIVRGPSGVFAMLDGRLTAEGDALGDGWTLTKIYHSERRIELAHTSGERFDIVMETPMQD